jgi:general secretion pathway protein J
VKKACINHKGFTLIELLIATALLSIILSAVYGAFFVSHKAMTGLDESLVRLQELRTTLDVMGRETESLLTPDSRNSLFKVEDRDFYGKQASRLTFTAFSPLSPGVSMISYYVEEKEGVLTLFKKMQNTYKPNPDAKGVELIEGLESFSVEVRDGNKWVKTWDISETKQAPLEVRITITSKIKDTPVSFFDTVRPKMGRAI